MTFADMYRFHFPLHRTRHTRRIEDILGLRKDLVNLLERFACDRLGMWAKVTVELD